MSDLNSSPQQKVAILRERLYVPAEFVTEEMLIPFQYKLEVGEDPETKEPIYDEYNHYSLQFLNADKAMYVFNRGNMDLIRQVFRGFQIIDERISVPMQNKLKIKFQNGKSWREYQPDAIDAMVNHEYGLMKAPPRSGKTLMIAAAICLEREKTLVFAHQTDLLEQLYDTFLDFTNLLELQTASNPVVGFANDIQDFEKLDVVLCTKQTFDHLSNKHMVPLIQKMFGSLYVDEVHFTAAEVYSKLINRFHAKNRRGVTATPKRKDGLDIVIDGVMGPVIYTITPEQVKQAPMEVTRINTGLKLKNLSSFHKLLKVLVESKGRNKLIVDTMEQDVRAGHILIAVTDRKEHQRILHQLLKERGIESVLFNGTLTDRAKRKQLLNRVRNKEVPVMIAMRNMTTGLDIPCADVFYNLLPSANAVSSGEHAGEGGYEQQCTRVRTPYEGKLKCYVRDFVDDNGVAYACWAERTKTYNKIGATLMRIKQDDVPEFSTYFAGMADDGLGDL